MKLFAIAVPAAALAAIFTLYLGGIDVSKLNSPRESATYTDRDGTVLGTVLGTDAQHCVRVPLRSVSPDFLEAIVAAEDARFWHRGAIDVPALLRAAQEYAVYGEARSGGSTIEMQLARLLHEIPSTILGKLAQIAVAQRIAIASSRDAVLEAYVNRVPMGGNLYGVEAAARTYFGEPAADLDLAQASLLAAIPNDPARLTPDVDWKALRSRQWFVLQRLVRLSEISPARANRAFAETLAVRRHDFGIADAAQALFFLYGLAPDHAGRVRTTLDRSLQRFTQAQTQDVIAALQAYHVSDGAALVADNRTGEVLAYVGSPDYVSDEVLGRNDGVQALRQPGSSLKPFTYELALERNTIASTTILADVPSVYRIPGGRLYQPADYSGRFSGPVRVRYALANSLNAPAVQVLSRLGGAPLLQRLHDLGFRHLDHPATYYGLGLTLGSGEVSLWELVQAYSTIARGGVYLPLQLIVNRSVESQSIGDTSDWNLVADMLADSHARAKSFGVGSVLQMPFPAAVKTGTSSDFRDTWTVGFTRDYTVGVWVGNFDGSAMRGVSGVTGAGPLWNRIMLHLYDGRDEPAPFASPRGFVRTAICATTGHSPSAKDGDCPVVSEWVRHDELAAVKRPAMAAGTRYDSWFALQAHAMGSPLRIVFPHDGDVFVRNADGSALQVHEQQLALHAIDSGGTIRWSVGGKSVAIDATGNAFWPLQFGTWIVEAADGRRHDRVRIRVVLPPLHAQPGFTVVGGNRR